MKKILSIGLVVVIVLSVGVMSFADSLDVFERGFGRGSKNTEFKQGYGRDLSDEDFNLMRESNRANLDLNKNFNFEENGIADLSSITNLTEEEIINSDLTLHEIAVNEGILDEFRALILSNKTEDFNKLVEDGTFSQEKANFMLNRMSNMDGFQQRLGQNGQRGSDRRFNRN